MCKDADQKWFDWWCSHIFFVLPFQAGSKVVGFPCPEGSWLHGGKLKLWTVKNMSCLIWKPKIMERPTWSGSGRGERRGLLRNKKWYRLGSSLPKKRREAAVTQILTLTASRMVARSQRGAAVWCSRRDWALGIDVPRPGRSREFCSLTFLGWCRSRELMASKQQEFGQRCWPHWLRWCGVKVSLLYVLGTT